MKRTLALVMAVAMIFALCACGSTSSSSSSAKSDIVELKFAHIYSATSNEYKWIQWICDEVESRSNGTLIIHNYSDSQLGTEAEVTPRILSGDIDFGLGESSSWGDASNIPQLGVFALPYLYGSLAGLKNAGLNIIPEAMNNLLDENNASIICMGGFSGGLRSLMGTGDAPTCAEDLKGFKLRVPQVDLYVKTMEAMGTVPTSISWAETYTSIAQGVVNGLENDYSSVVSMHIEEVIDWCYENNHIGCQRLICMNRDNFNKLSEEHQKILTDVFKEGCSKQFDDRETNLEESKQIMKDAGVVFVEPTSEDVEKLREACSALWDVYRDYGLGDLLDKLLEAGSI